MLLLGDHRAFFTTYRVITDAGLHAYQLDRNGALLKGGLEVYPLSVSALPVQMWHWLGPFQRMQHFYLHILDEESSGMQPEAVKKAIETAVKAADCILATYDHVAVADFPLNSFHCIIEYVCSPFNNKGEAAAAALTSAPCPRWH